MAFRRAVVRDAVKPMLRAQIAQQAAALERFGVALDPRPARELSGHVEQQQPDSAAAEVPREGAQQFVVKRFLALPVADRLALDDAGFPAFVRSIPDQVVGGTVLDDRAAEPVLQAAQSADRKSVV